MFDVAAEKQALLDGVKAQVKILTEEAVVRGYVHEDNSIITSLCAAVDEVLQYGLRLNIFNAFDDNLTLTLLRRISTQCPEAQHTLNRMDFYRPTMDTQLTISHRSPTENANNLWDAIRMSPRNDRKQIQGITPDMGYSTYTEGIIQFFRAKNQHAVKKAEKLQDFSRMVSKRPPVLHPMNSHPKFRHFWIRVALLEKVLSTILYFLAKNSSQYYLNHSVIADPCDGLLIADLLSGPCAIDYSRTRTNDHLYTDPPVTELIQRHAIYGQLMSRHLPYIYPTQSTENRHTKQSHSKHNLCTSKPSTFTNQTLSRLDPETAKNPESTVLSPSCVLSSTDLSSSPLVHRNRPSSVFPMDPVFAAKEHVDALHQSYKVSLIYGKNSVLVELRDNVLPTPGYLSILEIQRRNQSLLINWTPNWAMGSSELSAPDSTAPVINTSPSINIYRDAYWGHAVRVDLKNIAYIHCHLTGKYWSVQLISIEGIPLNPFLFNASSHMDAFLAALEKSLHKYDGRFDPPFMSYVKGENDLKVDSLESLPNLDLSTFNEHSTTEAVNIHRHSEPDMSDCLSERIELVTRSPIAKYRVAYVDDKIQNIEEKVRRQISPRPQIEHPSCEDALTIGKLCRNLRYEILWSAFQKWHSYHQVMNTIRSSLTAVVTSKVVSIDCPTNAEYGLTPQLWQSLLEAPDRDLAFQELCRHVYFGNCDPSIRQQVWPFLLGVYPLGVSTSTIEQLNQEYEHAYLHSLREWQLIEPLLNIDGSPAMSVTPELTRRVYPKPVANGSIYQSPMSNAFNGPPNLNENRISVTVDSSSVDVHSDHNNRTALTQLSGVNIVLDECPESSPHSPAESPCNRERLELFGVNVGRIDKDVSRCDRNHVYFAHPKKNTSQSCSSLLSIPDQVENLNANSQALRRVICTWTWIHLDVGYIQGMCDLLAPLLVVLGDETMAYTCFSHLMVWMLPNFPTSGARQSPTFDFRRSKIATMNGPLSAQYDTVDSPEVDSVHLLASRVNKFALPSPYISKVTANVNYIDVRFDAMKTLIKLFDPKLQHHLVRKSIDANFYFCYRWLLLDFKREVKYEDVYSVWEVIWSARRLVTYDFGIFLATAMLQYYRDIIRYYDMELTEVIRFFNELREQHDVKTLLDLARSLVFQVQNLQANI